VLQELEYPPTFRVVLLSIDNPLPEPLIIVLRPLVNLLPTHCKLRAARRTDPEGPLLGLFVHGVRVEGHVRRGRGGALENLLPNGPGEVNIPALALLAPGVPIAVQISVTVALDKGQRQHLQRGNVGVQGASTCQALKEPSRWESRKMIVEGR